MIITFYELKDEDGVYYVRRFSNKTPIILSYRASRIWKWDTLTDNVCLTKCSSGLGKVNLKEFTLVKLLATDLEKY